MKHKYLLPILLIYFFKSHAQDLELPFKFGDIPKQEFNMKFYKKDSTADAVVLYEKALANVVEVDNYLYIQTTLYRKIKIFNKDVSKLTSISIPLYYNLKSTEKITKIEGITHNLENGKDAKRYLLDKNIYKSKVNNHWKEVKFTLQDIRNGSIIEYTYTIQSPYFFNFTGWYFQSDIPKIYSELHAIIPVNWNYNIRIMGHQKLDINQQKLKRGCFNFDGLVKAADCEDLIYAMKDIPAFIEENYMTSKSNYLSYISFELAQYQSFNGLIKKYTNTWKDVDKKFRNDYAIGRQLKRVDYTKKLIPARLFTEKDTLKKAINIYHYIQNYFKWNGEYHVTESVDFKKAFKLKTGNVTEINIALCNALNAAGIHTEIMLLSTRKNGLPTYVHPVLSDFNYAIAIAQIRGSFYELDASYKLIPFGMLPFKALNSYGRLMDFKKGSYWQDIKVPRNVKSTSINLKFDKGILSGLMRIKSNAFTAYNKREALITEGVEKYKKDFENNSEMNELIIDSYRVSGLNNLEKMLVEDFKISFENESDNEDLLIINPYFDRHTINPFQLKERSYPVDFGYKQTENYRLNFNIPKGYVISSVPKNTTINLENNTASLTSNTSILGDAITINYQIRINKTIFSTKEYNSLKNFFKSIIDLQSQVIILKKKI